MRLVSIAHLVRARAHRSAMPMLGTLALLAATAWVGCGSEQEDDTSSTSGTSSGTGSGGGGGGGRRAGGGTGAAGDEDECGQGRDKKGLPAHAYDSSVNHAIRTFVMTGTRNVPSLRE